MVEKKKRKSAPHNKFKQNIQIKGQPDSIFVEKIGQNYAIMYDGDVIPLGHIGRFIAERLKKIPGIELKLSPYKRKARIKIPGVQHVKRVGNDTALVIAGKNKEDVERKVSETKKWLKEKGIDVDHGLEEKCSWVCITPDKPDVITVMGPTVPINQIAPGFVTTSLNPVGILLQNVNPVGVISEVKSSPSTVIDASSCQYGHRNCTNKSRTQCPHCHNSSRYEVNMRKKEIKELVGRLDP